MQESRVQEFLEQEQRIKDSMKKIRHKVAILSGKGGVGKSTVTANLAVVFARKGYRAGILDADIHGPTIPKLFGLRGQKLGVTDENKISPLIGPLQIKIVSMDLMLPSSDTPVIWRGPLKSVAIRQFLSDVEWGEMDWLLIDLPPGTGDEALSIVQLIQDLDGVVMVTAPSEVSQIVVRRAVRFVNRVGSRVIGVVENMSGFVCPKCGARFEVLGEGGGEKLAAELGLTFLGKIPLDQVICKDSDEGRPFVLQHPHSPSTEALVAIADRIERIVAGWK